MIRISVMTSEVKGQDHQAAEHRLKINHILGMGRPTDFKLGIHMQYDDPHHRHAW